MWLLLFACAQDSAAEARLLVDALAQTDPQEAARRCQALHGENRARCAQQVAPRLDAEAGQALCDGDGECLFRLAEAHKDPAICAKAGDFADDCRLHLLSARLPELLPPKPSPGAVESLVEPAISAAGLALDDPRPWSAVYRWVLGSQRPLDRSSCALAPDPMRQEACAQTALAHYNDLLNHLRDRGEDLCHDPLPARAEFKPDPELQALLTQRRAQDLCDPKARHAAPGAGLPGAGR